jgi:hypothetical protein
LLISFLSCTLHAHYRYKKFREAKDLSTKTEAERRAIFGSAMTKKDDATPAGLSSGDVFRTIKSSVGSGDSDEDSDKDKKRAKKEKKDKKDKKKSK